MQATNSRGKRGSALQADGRFAVAMVATVALLGCAAVLGIVIGELAFRYGNRLLDRHKLLTVN